MTYNTGSAQLDEWPVAQVQRVKALHQMLQSELEAWPVSRVLWGPQRLCCGAQPGQKHVLHGLLVGDVLRPHIGLQTEGDRVWDMGACRQKARSGDRTAEDCGPGL